jgi:hypothetical protein
LYERALATFERAFGSEHPSTAASLEKLALLLPVQRDLTAGRPLLERALAISGKALGPEHPIPTSLNNVARLRLPVLQRPSAMRHRGPPAAAPSRRAGLARSLAIQNAQSRSLFA